LIYPGIDSSIWSNQLNLKSIIVSNSCIYSGCKFYRSGCW